jgi:hypothetical protein
VLRNLQQSSVAMHPGAPEDPVQHDPCPCGPSAGVHAEDPSCSRCKATKNPHECLRSFPALFHRSSMLYKYHTPLQGERHGVLASLMAGKMGI